MADSNKSEKKKAKNWDAIEREIEEEEKNTKPEGEAALRALLQDIYSKGNEDTRRAMMKSFVESDGTVLSTNWNEVGKKHVDGTPPDGMEVRKYEM